MKPAARWIATTAVAFLIGPTLFADDTAKPKAPATKEETATSIAALDAPAKVPPSIAEPAPAPPSATILQSQSGNNGQQVGAMHKWDDSENHTPRIEWFVGYSFWRAMPTSNSNRMGYLHGGSTSIAYNFNRYVGLVADFAGFDNSRLTLFGPAGSETLNSNGSAFTYMFGPRFSYRKYERFTPFVQALFGGVHASAVTVSGCTGSTSCTPLGSDTAFATMLGTGFDVKINRHIALRLFEGDFLLTHFRDPLASSANSRGWQDNARFSTGIVFRFGGNPPAPPSAPLTASCSASPDFVYAGSGDAVSVRAEASNSGNYPLNYIWSANEGTVDGSGPEARWNSADRRPGEYTVSVRVDNGRSVTAGCSVGVRVMARPNRPPTMSCAADRGTVTVGDRVEITATASDPDNDPLSFSWRASGGRLEGEGSSVRLHTDDLAPGSYTISGHVEDGRGGTADCSVSVDVQAPQPPPEVKELETRLALHSIYFATARPTEQNPASGLLESQQQVLISLARDFNRYLTFKPDARLTLEGHADKRGAAEYNQRLTQRRVDRSKSFLVEHGVPAASIETRAVGEQDNLTAEQVKQLVDQNPDLSNDERHRLDSNLQVITWANNRRVDISLSTTGQQSVRQYPFNARDSLALLSAAGGETGKRTKAPAKEKAAKP